MKIWKKSGILLFATGVIHNTLGFFIGWGILTSIANAGFVNSINKQMDRGFIFWFLFSGFMMMLLGHLMHYFTKETPKPLPASLGYYLLILTAIGCIMMPVSGFWLVVPQSIIIIMANKAKDVALPAKV